MDPRTLTPRYTVSPQITPEDIPAIKEAGFTTVICNRPDQEIPPALHAEVMARAVAEAGLAFHVLPLTHQTMTPERVAEQARLIAESEGPVLAYCASGTRCTVVWALDQAARLPVDEVLQTASRAGYNLDGLRPTLDQVAASSQAG